MDINCKTSEWVKKQHLLLTVNAQPGFSCPVCFVKVFIGSCSEGVTLFFMQDPLLRQENDRFFGVSLAVASCFSVSKAY